MLRSLILGIFCLVIYGHLTAQTVVSQTDFKSAWAYDISGKPDFGKGLAFTADGKILCLFNEVGGLVSKSGVLRLERNGQRDLSFGLNGISSVSNCTSKFRFIGTQSDGKIVLAGEQYVDGRSSFALARLSADGKSVDASFKSVEGCQGYNFESFQSGAKADDDQLNCMLIQPDDKIVLAGSSLEISGSTYRRYACLMRFLPNGELDPSFGKAGKLKMEYKSGKNWIVNRLAMAADGKIVLAGSWGTNPLLCRILPDGKIDSSFAIGGYNLTTVLDGRMEYNDLHLYPDGSMVLAASRTKEDQSSFQLSKLAANNFTDRSFGLIDKKNFGGSVSTGFTKKGSTDLILRDLEVAKDGSLYVMGEEYKHLCVAKYDASGNPDLSFGIEGKIYSYLGEKGGDEYRLHQAADGSLWIVGHISQNDNRNILLIEL